MNIINILLSVILSLLAYFSFFVFLLFGIATRKFSTGIPKSLNERLQDGTIFGSIPLLLLFLGYKFLGVEFIHVVISVGLILVIYFKTQLPSVNLF